MQDMRTSVGCSWPWNAGGFVAEAIGEEEAGAAGADMQKCPDHPDRFEIALIDNFTLNKLYKTR